MAGESYEFVDVANWTPQIKIERDDDLTQTEPAVDILGSDTRSQGAIGEETVVTDFDLSTDIKVENCGLQCDICGDAFDDEVLSRLHSLQHSRDQRYCEICHFLALTPSLYQQHFVQNHVYPRSNVSVPRQRNDALDEGAVLCLCGKVLKSRATFLRHYTRVHQEGDLARSFQCLVCHLQATSQSKINRHFVEQHFIQLTCSLCKLKCRDLTMAKLHVNKAHRARVDQAVPRVIAVTSTGSLSQLDLVDEVKKQESELVIVTPSLPEYGEPPVKPESDVISEPGDARPTFYCPECGRGPFKSKAGIHVHHESAHSSVVYECALCGLKTKIKNNLNSHMRTVHFGTLHQCSQCSFSSKHKRSVTAHFKAIHQNDYYQCPHCGLRTPYKKNLDYHVRDVHQSERLQCPMCHKRPKNKRCLVIHLRRIHAQSV